MRDLSLYNLSIEDSPQLSSTVLYPDNPVVTSHRYCAICAYSPTDSMLLYGVLNE